MRRWLISARPLSLSLVSLKLSGLKQAWHKGEGCKETEFLQVLWKTDMRQRQKLLLPCKEPAVCASETHVRVVLPAVPVISPRLVRWLVSVLPAPEHLLVPGTWWRELEVLWVEKAKGCGRSDRVGEGSHSWEGWGCHSQDVLEEEKPVLPESVTCGMTCLIPVPSCLSPYPEVF